MLESANLTSAVTALLGKRITDANRIYAGRNSRVYRVACEDGSAYAVKHYEAGSPVERLEVEFAALRFLQSHGFVQTPHAVALDAAQGIGVYEYVEGTPPSAPFSAADMDAAQNFTLQLDALAGSARGEWQKTAAEACFSLGDVVLNIQARLERLKIDCVVGPLRNELHQFISADIEPLLVSVTHWGEKKLVHNGTSMDETLPLDARTLSPSDFGFHNAVRGPDCSMVFLDLEYFGWDDPAKTISDFLLHPAMELGEDMKRRFVAGLCGALRGRTPLVKRLPVAYALFGVKWCTILLNEFVPAHFARRVFAGDSRAREDVLAEQLAKAETLCAQIAGTFEDFAYFE